MLTYLIAAALAVAPQQDWARDRAAAAELGIIAKGCELDYETGPTRGINYRHEIERNLRAMLKDPPTCPGVAQQAAAWIARSVGAPERGDVDIEMLERAWKLVREGRFVRADRAVELRYARIIWLFDGPRRLKEYPKAEWEAWAQTPEAVALLAARNEDKRARTRQSLVLEIAMRLRRDTPFYDPARAANLLSDALVMNSPETRAQTAAMWTDGVHLPRDYARAAVPYRYMATIDGENGAVHRRGLLVVARLAAAAARTPAERALAINLLFGATLGGETDRNGERDALVKRLGRVPVVALAAGDAEKIGRAIDWEYGWALGTSGAEKPAPGNLIRLRALVGPDGRVVLVTLTRSCGVAERDRRAMGVWFQYRERADLSATARGRFVWADLPPVDPAMTSSDAYQRWNK
ncbi:hypothetical protein [Sphingomonas sp. LT1P40]|uniref:hypothetical protein n=1 Tax=Alteristakelama amylovorans TaxID=3096166 RepID=UPI002FC7F050